MFQREKDMATEATRVRVDSPSYQAYQILHIAFTVAPIVAGIDKFFHFLVNWDQYLSPIVPRTLGISAHSFMLGVGVIEVIAGLLVAVAPRIGGWVVGLWLSGIIVNLLTIPAHLDIALRDLGLALGAFALARLSVDYSEL
jgi:small-conductance mechanosensitive channel